ncbi:Hint domain-containing protein [Aestuariibius sp. 2305UL40-4]|uniref:Hint domain-containing protein n=1 Tax=Aestuariibius violaceus TaxID=3234132 RepID=UPI00345E204D
MPSFFVWTPADFGTTGFSTSGTFTMTGSPDVIDVTDDDASFNDGTADTVSPADPGTPQTLTNDAVLDGVTVGTAGQDIQNGAEATITNNTTGEIGTLIYVTIGDDGTGAGFVGYASTIEINPGDSFTISNLVINPVEEDYANLVVCFARGTLIRTPDGDRPVEDLVAGDLVETMDDGAKPIRWIGSRIVAAEGSLAPIRIEAGAIGNTRPLTVSPQHRVLLMGWQAELYYGHEEVLVSAKHLLNSDRVTRVEGGEIEYFHILFDTHQIIFSEDAPTESFHPGETGLNAVQKEQKKELLHLFPELMSDPDCLGPSARPSLKRHEGELFSRFL